MANNWCTVIISYHCFLSNTSYLLTECNIHNATTKGQYSPVRLEQAQLVSCLLYGTQFLRVKCTACFSFWIKSFQIFRIIKLAWRTLVFFIHLQNLGKISILLAFSSSFTVNNDNIHIFFLLFWLQILNLRLCSKTKIPGLDHFHRNGPYCKILTKKEPITQICLRLASPYNNLQYNLPWVEVVVQVLVIE